MSGVRKIFLLSIFLLIWGGVFQTSAQICRVRHPIVAPVFEMPVMEKGQIVRAGRDHAIFDRSEYVASSRDTPFFVQPRFVQPIFDPCAGNERVSINGQSVSPTIYDVIMGNRSVRRDAGIRDVIMRQVRPLGKASDPRQNLNLDTSILCCDGSGGGAVPASTGSTAPVRMQTRTGRLQ